MSAVQATLSGWLARDGERFYETMIGFGKQPQLPHYQMTDREAAVELARAERDRVTAKDGLYLVSPEMTRLAVTAGAKLPYRELYAHDLPSTRGLMIFGEPLTTYRMVNGRDVDIVAVSWGPWAGPTGEWPDGGVWLSFYSDLGPHQPRAYSGPVRQLADRLGCPVGPLVPDNEAGWPFGELTSTDFPPDSTGLWAQSLCAAWLLMAQPLADTSLDVVPAADRTRIRKAGFSPARGVQVVRLRRRERQQSRQGEKAHGRAYQHRWPVMPHWRRYHCGPGGARIERRWIDLHVAGPEDKPVKALPHVRVWDR
ncbi:hypothetical protein [Micromonospora aurantiaca (nom. illeg.)]|uniref:hypothetical protein n=1 Tax=Micromonospora aurantiaca (nom. illeg.) TaxID=47850 RepID=UPI0033C74BD9